LRHAVIGFGYGMGFPKVTAYGQHPATAITWADHIATFTGKPRQPAGDEPASANELVKVYPVRTELSRCLTGNADCAVVIVPSLDKEQGVIPPKVREAASKLMAQLKLQHKKQVSFYLGHVPDADRQQLLDDLSKLATAMGFETRSVTFR